MEKLKVGQEVYLKPLNNMARYKKEIITAKIQKVGRKYAEAIDKNQVRVYVFHLDSMYQKSDYSADFKVYASLEDIENSINEPIERSKTIARVSNLSYSDLKKVQEFISKL
jgi:ribosomal protein S24E